jgi:hypothetical protein
LGVFGVKRKVLCLGNVVVDVLARPVDKLPPSGGLSLVRDIRLALGGCASNTAAALGKMGAGAEAQLGSLLAGRDPRQRSLAVLAAAQSGDADLLRLVKVGLRDSRPEVRRCAVESLFAVQEPYKPRRREFLEELRHLEASDPNPGVRAAAGRAAKVID